MKKTAENRYPHSATLFRFCKEALEMRYSGNVKVIDQDVGAILGYDPADCSHWKKGKKNIRSLPTLKKLANHLDIDERLLVDIAAGKIDLDEAIFEYKGYGRLVVSPQQLDELRKVQNHGEAAWIKDLTASHRSNLETYVQGRLDLAASTAIQLLRSLNIHEAPVYLPEVLRVFPQIELHMDRDAAEFIAVQSAPPQDGKGRVRLIIRGGEIKAYSRFMVAKELFHILQNTEQETFKDFKQDPDEIQDLLGGSFAAALLMPPHLIKSGTSAIDFGKDYVDHLAQRLWVSRSLMGEWLKSKTLRHILQM